MVRRILIVLALLTSISCTASPPGALGEQSAGASPAVGWAITVHGGAGIWPGSLTAEEQGAYRASLERALRAGVSTLEGGGKSLDAVERVLRFLEDDPLFNAGKGAVFNHDGLHELDASVMDGATLACGAVAGVKTVKNPISLARFVMEETDHVLLHGDGAERFAEDMGLAPVDQTYFFTRRRWESWQKILRKEDERRGGGTVGAAALDIFGNLAAGTSTGGLSNKMYGRVGDSPIIGAGTYAANDTCAVSCSGKGEEFIRRNVAYQVSALMEHAGLSLQEAAEQIVDQQLQPGDGGLIGVSAEGEIAMVFNTPGMLRGAADSTGRFEIGIWE